MWVSPKHEPAVVCSAFGHQTASRAFRGQCHYCKKFGHRIAECTKRLAKGDASSRPVSTPVVTASVAHDNDSSGQIVNSVQCDHAAVGHTSSNAIPTCNFVVEGTQAVSCVLNSGAVTSIVSDTLSTVRPVGWSQEWGVHLPTKVYVVSIKCNRTALKFFVDSPLWKHG